MYYKIGKLPKCPLLFLVVSINTIPNTNCIQWLKLQYIRF